MRYTLLMLLLWAPSFYAVAQKNANPQDSVKMPPAAVLIDASFGFMLPLGHMGQRYGYCSSAEGGIRFLSKKNWIFGVEGDYLFGDKVKEDVLGNLFNQQGFITSSVGSQEVVVGSLRGFYIGASFGKLIPISKRNKRSALDIEFGGGYLQHRINIDNPNGSVPQVGGDYRKGYDRLSGGFALKQKIGYRLMIRRQFINFYVGLEFTEAFTQSYRSWDADRMQADTGTHFDFIPALRVAWTLPLELYSRETERIYYY